MVTTIVALDLGTTHVRGIEAEIKNGQPPKIKKIHAVQIESDITSSGNIVNEEALTVALKRLWEEAKFKSKLVVSMAAGEAYENRMVSDIPWSPPEDFKKLLPHYLRDKVPFELDEYYFDAHTLDEYFKTPDNAAQGTPPVRMKKILVAAVEQKFSDSFVKAVENAGLRPLALDILPLALIRSQSQDSTIPQNATVVSVEIGGEVITIVIHKNFQPLYMNTATFFGGLRITSEIAQTLGITLTEAEMLKTAFSLEPEKREELSTTSFLEDGTTIVTAYSSFTPDQKEQAASIVSREVSNIIAHVSDILEDAFSNSTETPFRIVLSGGGSGLHTLLNRMQNELGIPTVITQPFSEYTASKIDDNVLANQHIYASVYGLLVGQNETK